MTRRVKSTSRPAEAAPRGWVRTGSFAALAAIPALAVAVLGADLVSRAGQMPALPSGLMISETREFGRAGQMVPAAKSTITEPVEQFMNEWQNTVRTPPSPRV